MIPLISQQSSFHDSDAFCSALNGFNAEFTQLDQGALEANLEISSSSNCVVQRLSFNRRFYQRGVGPEDMLSFGVPDVRMLKNWRGKKLDGHSLLNFTRRSGYESVSEGGFSAYTFSISKRLIREHIDLLGYNLTVDDFQEMADWPLPNQLAYDQFRRVGSQFLRQNSHHTVEPVNIDDLELTLAYIITDHICDAPLKEYRSDSALENKAISRALELIHCQQGNLTIKDLQRSAETSWRTLGRAFQKRFGISPKQYLLAARLHAVRKELRSPHSSNSITEIAPKWGFNHLGRFSAYYYTMYGELPSHTLRK